MSPTVIGLIVGGLLPALLFGVAGVLQKASMQAATGLGPYLIGTGLGVIITGVLVYGLVPQRSMPIVGLSYAVLMGLFWSAAVGLVAVGLTTYGLPLAKLVPLYNMNTLVAVLLGLWLFAEWQNVMLAKLLLGALLIVVGGFLVATA